MISLSNTMLPMQNECYPILTVYFREVIYIETLTFGPCEAKALIVHVWIPTWYDASNAIWVVPHAYCSREGNIPFWPHPNPGLWWLCWSAWSFIQLWRCWLLMYAGNKLMQMSFLYYNFHSTKFYIPYALWNTFPLVFCL